MKKQIADILLEKHCGVAWKKGILELCYQEQKEDGTIEVRRKDVTDNHTEVEERWVEMLERPSRIVTSEDSVIIESSFLIVEKELLCAKLIKRQIVEDFKEKAYVSILHRCLASDLKPLSHVVIVTEETEKGIVVRGECVCKKQNP